MKYSTLFGKTIKDVPHDIVSVSHKLLYKAGYIRDSSNGRYYFLPLGLKVHQKIQKIIKEEMDAAGYQEIVTPIFHPVDLWKETGRTESVGFELLKVRDRNNAEFVLGGTAEEMLVELVRKFQVSYKDMPFGLYQFSTKFRDEMRSRGGLLRMKEFVMKDAYSFNISQEDFKDEYMKMQDVYKNIFKRVGLDIKMVSADNGYIGGDYCHEFIVESDVGESQFLESSDGTYLAHQDIAKFSRGEILKEEFLPLEYSNSTNNPISKFVRGDLFKDENNNFYVVFTRGDIEVNTIKLAHVLGVYDISKVLNDDLLKMGFLSGKISPFDTKGLKTVGDISLKTIVNGYAYSKYTSKYALNINYSRDFQLNIIDDIALAPLGSLSEDGKDLILKKGVEVGHIFQLGFHYSSKMSGAHFTDKDGKTKPYYMGCYGIGIARTLATIVEVHHDDKGIVWPESVAPFMVHLVGINMNDSKVKEAADKLYKKLTDIGVDVLYDDRLDVFPGEKLSDADIIGIPHRVVISPKTLKDGNNIEYMLRKDRISKILNPDKLNEEFINQ